MESQCPNCFSMFFSIAVPLTYPRGIIFIIHQLLFRSHPRLKWKGESNQMHAAWQLGIDQPAKVVLFGTAPFLARIARRASPLQRLDSPWVLRISFFGGGGSVKRLSQTLYWSLSFQSWHLEQIYFPFIHFRYVRWHCQAPNRLTSGLVFWVSRCLPPNPPATVPGRISVVFANSLVCRPPGSIKMGKAAPDAWGSTVPSELDLLKRGSSSNPLYIVILIYFPVACVHECKNKNILFDSIDTVHSIVRVSFQPSIHLSRTPFLLSPKNVFKWDWKPGWSIIRR